MSDQTVSTTDLETLLALQDLDLKLDVLRHRREALPERAELVTLLAEGARLHTRLVDLRSRRDEVLAEERRLDDESRSLTAKAKDVEGRMYSGTVSSPRELQAMQADIEQLKRHRSSLEDSELEIMEQREQLDAEVSSADAAVRAAAGEVGRLQKAISEGEAAIDAEVVEESSARDALAERISGALLADYERRRAHNRGIGAARLAGGTCQACRLSIPATEVDRMRHDSGDGVAYCDNCGAILVLA